MHKSPRQDAQTILLYIDSYHMEIPEGRFFCPGTGETDSFRGLVQMLLKIEQCLDIRNTPQGFHTIRSFSGHPVLWPVPQSEVDVRPGQRGSFHLQFLFRRNASWQGRITWLETGRSMYFRSALELIILLSSALAGTAGEEWTERDYPMEG